MLLSLTVLFASCGLHVVPYTSTDVHHSARGVRRASGPRCMLSGLPCASLLSGAVLAWLRNSTACASCALHSTHVALPNEHKQFSFGVVCLLPLGVPLQD